MGACAQIPVLFVMRGVIIKFSQISPGSFRHAGRNYQILCVTPHTLEKLDPVSCAHAEAEEGHREA